MINDDPTVEELAAEIKRLQKRVSELEAAVDGNPSGEKKTASGRRDAAVIEHIEQHGDPGPRKTVELYKQLTDISQEKTAKRRAKQLRNSQQFKEATQ